MGPSVREQDPNEFCHVLNKFGRLEPAVASGESEVADKEVVGMVLCGFRFSVSHLYGVVAC